jgi:hypothetical protein
MPAAAYKAAASTQLRAEADDDADPLADDHARNGLVDLDLEDDPPASSRARQALARVGALTALILVLPLLYSALDQFGYSAAPPAAPPTTPPTTPPRLPPPNSPPLPCTHPSPPPPPVPPATPPPPPVPPAAPPRFPVGQFVCPFDLDKARGIKGCSAVPCASALAPCPRVCCECADTTTCADSVWPGMAAQWRRAQAELGVADNTSAITGAQLDLHLGSRIVPGVYHAIAHSAASTWCTAHFHGLRLLYVHNYKVNTQGICGNLMRGAAFQGEQPRSKTTISTHHTARSVARARARLTLTARPRGGSTLCARGGRRGDEHQQHVHQRLGANDLLHVRPRATQPLRLRLLRGSHSIDGSS